MFALTALSTSIDSQSDMSLSDVTMSPITSPLPSNKSDTKPDKPLKNFAHILLNSNDSSNRSSNSGLEPIVESYNSTNTTSSVQVSEHVKNKSNDLLSDYKPVNISGSTSFTKINNNANTSSTIPASIDKNTTSEIDSPPKSSVSKAWRTVSGVFNNPSKKNINKYALGSKSDILNVISNNSNFTQATSKPSVDIVPIPNAVVPPSISNENIVTKNNSTSAWEKVSFLLNKPSKKNINKYGLGVNENTEVISNIATHQLTKSSLKANETIINQLSTVTNLTNTNDTNTITSDINYNNVATRSIHLSNTSLASIDSKQTFHKNGKGLSNKIRSVILSHVHDNELIKDKEVTNEDDNDLENNNICYQISPSEKLKVALERIKDGKNKTLPITNIVANDFHKENLPTSIISNTDWDNYLLRSQPISLSKDANNIRQLNLDEKRQSLIYQLKLEERFRPETLLILSTKIKDKNDKNTSNSSIVSKKKFKIKVPTSISLNLNQNNYNKNEIVSEINEIKGISMSGYLYKKNNRGVFKRRFVTLSSENKYNQSVNNSMEGFNACYLRIYNKKVSSIWGEISLGLKFELHIKDIVQMTSNSKSKGTDFNVEFHTNNMNIIDEDDGAGEDEEEEDFIDVDGDKKSVASHANIVNGNISIHKLKFRADDATERFKWVSWIESAIELEKV